MFVFRAMKNGNPLSMEDATSEKLQEINKELADLHNHFIQEGYSEKDVRIMASPVLSRIPNVWLTYTKRHSFLLFILCIALVLYCVTPVAKFLFVLGRCISITWILPFWDWTGLYYDECLVRNPHYSPNILTYEDCQACEDLVSIKRSHDVTHNEVSEDFIYKDTPLIITDATSDWKARHFDIQDVNKIYQDDVDLNAAYGCSFTTNLRLKSSDNVLFMKRAAADQYKRYFAYWENCEQDAAKALRRYIDRPYFLPPMVELAKPNWIFISNDYMGRHYKNISSSTSTSIFLFAQLRGKHLVQLTPKTPCEKLCITLNDTLEEGEILMFTERMWQMQYLPASPDPTIALGLSGYF